VLGSFLAGGLSVVSAPSGSERKSWALFRPWGWKGSGSVGGQMCCLAEWMNFNCHFIRHQAVVMIGSKPRMVGEGAMSKIGMHRGSLNLTSWRFQIPMFLLHSAVRRPDFGPLVINLERFGLSYSPITGIQVDLGQALQISLACVQEVLFNQAGSKDLKWPSMPGVEEELVVSSYPVTIFPYFTFVESREPGTP